MFPDPSHSSEESSSSSSVWLLMLEYNSSDRLYVEILVVLLQVPECSRSLVCVSCQQYSGRSDLSCAIPSVTISTAGL